MFGKGRQRARAERAQSQLEERIRDVEAERDDLKVEVEELSKVGETFRTAMTQEVQRTSGEQAQLQKDLTKSKAKNEQLQARVA